MPDAAVYGLEQQSVLLAMIDDIQDRLRCTVSGMEIKIVGCPRYY